jgi:hypothetical protein
MTKMNWDKVRQQKKLSGTQPENKPRSRGPKPFIPPTAKQISFMKKLGIPYREGMSIGDCSSLISTCLEIQAKSKQ